jgi:alpha/beta superfamily hydrolase
MREEKVLIPSDSIQLEGLLSVHEAFSAKGGAILCHPHPQYGGDMDSPVITTAAEIASQEGFCTLRFNFRGVGESRGSYGDGVGERKDAEAAINYLYTILKDSNLPLILLGYSFGAWVGSSVAAHDRRIKGMVGIAPPLELYDFGFLKKCKKEKLFIAGNRDFFCPVTVLEKWYQQLEEPKSLTIIQGADHFFFAHTQFLIEPLEGFLKVIS